ncbi:MAG: PrsW family glutamic-type intramembrane protease [Candidatus Paceibacterota bacterium]|jgi:RsiW-degrading membrane proteinase PrsW (M82 family)
MDFFNFSTITISILSGLLPALVWLWFWLREDSEHPEPRRIIIFTFLAGALATLLAIPLEKMVIDTTMGLSVGTFLLAGIEEALKFCAAYIVALTSINDDEPIDPVIYMITAALGFAALENILFFVSSLMENQGILQSLITINIRFVGAMLLHTASSAVIGVALALTFYKRMRIRIPVIIISLCGAIILHAFFNFFIIKGQTHAFFTFFVLWCVAILLMLIFEKIKHIFWNREQIQ